ncbi:MAG: histidinol dehydrogenase [Planctomycetota bacterium]|nr:MAG: histidinol dehydrogenase [Planctomycetota bacterium]
MLKVTGSLPEVRNTLSQIRRRLGIRGDIVSDSGRRRTIELFGEPLTPQQVVERICADVRSEGIAAVLRYTEKLDGRRFTADTLRVPGHELAAAHQTADREFLHTVRYVRANIEQFQRAVLPTDATVRRELGGGHVELRQRCVPLRRVGVCVPGGAAAYPSTLLMTIVPAQVAGVAEIAVVVPPTEHGAFNRDVLAVCHELGVREVYRMGGAQAVAALAYGIEGVPRVDKIVGPGNLFVALAKRHVYGEVDIDSIAGPSEVIVLADASARPEFVAADLISQAEHSPGSSILITWHQPLLDAVEQAVERQLQQLQRGRLARESLEEFGALVAVDSLDDAAALTDWMAPEHLHISTSDPQAVLARVRNAGAIFLGHFTPVALGDYVAGPSHVLPTGGTARFASGLSAVDFVKRSSVIAYDAAALAHDAEHVRRLADREGLTAHRFSVDIRLQDDRSTPSS